MNCESDLRARDMYVVGAWCDSLVLACGLGSGVIVGAMRLSIEVTQVLEDYPAEQFLIQEE